MSCIYKKTHFLILNRTSVTLNTSFAEYLCASSDFFSNFIGKKNHLSFEIDIYIKLVYYTNPSKIMNFDGESSVSRNFGFIKIEWKVKNYFSATCTDYSIIGSPTFSVRGKNSTKWRLFLSKQTDSFENKSIFCASLTKVGSDSSHEPFLVSWKLFFPCDFGRSEFEAESDFEDKNYIDIEIGDACDLDKYMQHSVEDTLIIRSVLFVSTKDSQIYKRPKDLGLKSLSQDLTILFRVGGNRDLKLHSGEFSVKYHKGILCCRNNVLKRAVEKDDFVTTLPELDMDALENVFVYLYTGNLDCVLRKPSLEVLQCVQYFGMTKIEEYYKADEVELCSEFKMKEYKFECAIPVEQIVDSNIVIHSSSMLKNVSQSEHDFTLKYSLESVTGTGMSDYISVFIEGRKESFPKTSYIELAVMNVHGSAELLQRQRSPSNVSFQNFLPRDILKHIIFTGDGKLHLLCNVYIPIMNSRLLTTVNKTVHSDIFIDSEEHYKMLSNHMSGLFETGLYSDITLTCDGERFRVHTSILSARSHVFKTMFKRKRRATSFEICYMKGSVLRLVLYYIYSGKLPNCEIAEILDIYEAAERFYVLPLKHTCSEILQVNVKFVDINRALSLAENFKDYKLLYLLQKSISHKTSV